MRFGIFYEHQLPRPWSRESEYRLLQDSLTQIELADRLGYDYAWEVEHHFLEEYSHSSAPEVFLGAASQRTKRIRLGHGVIQLPTNHPIRVAERVSTLDLLERRTRRARPRRGAGPGRAASLRPARARQARRVGGGGPGPGAVLHAGVRRVPRPVLRLPGAQRHPEAVSEAAPAALGGLLEHPDHRQRGALGHGRARLSVRHAGGGAGLGQRVLHEPDPAPGQARRLSGRIRTSRW